MPAGQPAPRVHQSRIQDKRITSHLPLSVNLRLSLSGFFSFFQFQTRSIERRPRRSYSVARERLQRLSVTKDIPPGSKGDDEEAETDPNRSEEEGEQEVHEHKLPIVIISKEDEEEELED